MRTLLKPLSFIPAILLMVMIFNFSSQTGEVSSQVSYNVSYKIIQAGDYLLDADLEPWQVDEWANKINFITRKLAHMTIYFALAIAVSFPLYVYGMHGIFLMLVAGIICIGFAAGDEYHQSFVAGRGPSWKDVGIDSIGVFFGIILVRMIGWTGRMTIFKSKNKKPKVKKIKKVKKVTTKNREHTYYEDTQKRNFQSHSVKNPQRNHGGHGYPPQEYPPNGYAPYNYPPNGHPPYDQGGASHMASPPPQPPYGWNGYHQPQQPYEEEAYYQTQRPYQQAPYQQPPYQQTPYHTADDFQNQTQYYDRHEQYEAPPKPMTSVKNSKASDEDEDDVDGPIEIIQKLGSKFFRK